MDIETTGHCRHCKKVIADYKLADGCPCNSPRGINHGLVPAECCTCKECDPEQTGSSRMRPTVFEGTVRRMKDDRSEAVFALVGADGSYNYEVLGYEHEDKKVRITIEEIP